jgi:hypothetical protein
LSTRLEPDLRHLHHHHHHLHPELPEDKKHKPMPHIVSTDTVSEELTEFLRDMLCVFVSVVVFCAFGIVELLLL